jgi:hypothetical protein
MLELKEYQEFANGKKVAIIYRKDKLETLRCPFCKKKNTHIHGFLPGHRIPHCVDYNDVITASDGSKLFHKNGYIIVNL